MNGAQIGGLLCFLVASVTVGSLIGAVILRASVSLYNKMAGGESSVNGVPEPAFGKAFGIAFATALVNSLVGIGVGIVTGVGAAAAGQQGTGVTLLAQLISLPVTFLVMAGMLTAMLPTSFGRAILVTLCYFVVAILVALVIGVVVAVVLVAAGIGLRGN